MPDDGLKGFRVRRDVVGIHRGDDDAGGRFLCRVATVASDDAHDGGADRLGELNGGDEIGRASCRERV